MRYLPHTPDDISAMLSVIGKPTVESLFDSIPHEAQLQRPLDIGAGLPEMTLKKMLVERAGQAPRSSFLGAGATAHFAPESVSQMLLRSEWYTSYTPYQPELSQGTLQAIFEFQTMTASLYGCEIANASMYDGATALIEALLMAARINAKANVFLVSKAVHPEYIDVCRTYLQGSELQVVEIPVGVDGRTDLEALQKILAAADMQGKVAAVAYQTPNFFGVLEDQEALCAAAKQVGAVPVAANTEPVALALVRSPGRAGAEIVVGEGIGLCGHTSLGGPGVGLFATSSKHLRQMPGRLCGQTLDADGNSGYVLTLSTREQHIRRDKATSNICTNHGLMALAFSMTLSLYGKQGFDQLARQNLAKTRRFRSLLSAQSKTAHVMYAGSPHFNETVVAFSSPDEMQDKYQKLAAQDVFAGVPLAQWFPHLDRHLLVATTELHSSEEIAHLATSLS